MTTLEATPLDALLAARPYALPPAEKRELLLLALNESYRHHFCSCAAYRRFCERRGFGPETRFAEFADFPFLPVAAFKHSAQLLRSVPPADITTRLQSSATSGVPSTVELDRKTARNQVRALAAVISEVLGPRRRPFLVLDVDPRRAGPDALGARGAAVRGFLNLAQGARFLMDPEPGGALRLREEDFAAALEESGRAAEPIVVFGFTYVLYLHAVAPLLHAGRSFRLPPGSTVVHIGGWKKLADKQVGKSKFIADAARVFGVPPSAVIDFYGFTEQMGVTYPDGGDGEKCAPSFAEVIVRDPSTLEPLPDGREGLLEFLTPVPHSYPGLAVLTDDIGVITGRDGGPDGWCGTRFRVLGRAAKAEVRGCGDIMGEKMGRPGGAFAALPPESAHSARPRLLWDGACNLAAGALADPVDWSGLPELPDLAALSRELRDHRARLDTYSVDDRIALIAAAAERWAAPSSPLGPLRQQGLLFLTSWCQGPALRRLADDSLRGQRGFLDGFRAADGDNRRLLRAQPRGLVAHWLAGNVPLLAMLTLAQSIIAGNCNLLKSASASSRILPALLDGFRGLTLIRPDGRVLSGDDIARSIAVVYFPREARAAAEELSAIADVRLAWGGREAVESVMNLPRRFGTEDIIFGPKLSYMVIGRETLATPRLVRRLARLAATDASVFDQYACASPHTIFVETGGAAASPREFAEVLAAEMAKAAVRIPKGPVDAGAATRVNAVRMRYEFTSELWHSRDTTWTVLFDESAAAGLAEPCYSRVICVRGIDDALRAARFAGPGTQTIGLSLAGARRLAFASAASALGAERFPEIGRMTHFDTPWDSVYPLDRLVRWVTLGGPA